MIAAIAAGSVARLRRRARAAQPDVVVLRRAGRQPDRRAAGHGRRCRPSPCCCRSPTPCIPCPAILMLAGIFYGSQYGGAIGAILLNLPCHPPHAVTCLDGYPMTRAGQGRHRARHHHDRVVLRGVVRHHRDDFRLAAAGADRVQVRPDGDLLDHAARPARRRHHVARIAAQGRGDDRGGPADRRGRHRRQHAARRASPSAFRTRRQGRTGRAGARAVRRRRIPAQRQPHCTSVGNETQGAPARHAPEQGGTASRRSCRWCAAR